MGGESDGAQMMEQAKKIELMHQLFGKAEGHTCKECSNFCSGRYHDRILRKCEVYGLTHSKATDWAMRWTACGHFNRPLNGRPVIEIRRRMAKPKQAERVTGQLSWW